MFQYLKAKFQQKHNRLATSTKGSVAVTYAVSLVAISAAVGAAVDYSRAMNVEAKMQQAADNAALASVQVANGSKAEMHKVAKSYFEENVLNGLIEKSPKIKIKKITDGIRVTAKLKIRTTFLSVVNIKNIKVTVVSEVAKPSSQKLEVVLAIDSTSSMSGRLSKVKSHARSFAESLLSNTHDNSVKFGLVPYSKYVNIGTENLNMAGTYIHPSNPSWTWYGCMGSRSNVLDTRDDNYITSPAPGLKQKNDYYCKIRPISRLSSDPKTVKQNINKLNSAGIDEFAYLEPALLWSWAVLSSNAPYTEAGAYSPDLQKVIIMINDSTNTRGPNNAFSGGSTDPNHYNKSVSIANKRTRDVCENIRDKNIKVFIIDFGNASALENCAANGGKYYALDDTDNLDDTFIKISRKIANGGGSGVLRITR